MRSNVSRSVASMFTVATALLLVSSFSAGSAAAAKPAHPIAGTLTYVLNEDPKTLDPATMSEAVEDTVAAYIGAELVTVDPSTSKILPWLATSWKWSNNNTTLTMKLRQGVTFQASGKTMTAQDIVNSYERDLNPKTGSPIAAQALNGVTAITAPNPSTLVFQLSAPNGAFLLDLANTYLQPVDPVQLKKYGANYGLHPSSVGPYQLKSWVPGVSVTLQRYTKYNWAPSFDQPGAPFIKTMKFLVIPQSSSQIAAFNSGQVSILSIPAQNWPQYQNNPNYQFWQVVTGRLGKIDFNLKEPMFQNVLVRRAFSYALNRQQIVQGALNGHGLPGWGPYPPNLEYFDKNLNNAYPYNPQKAESLLKQAGYTYNSSGQLLDKNGKPVVLNMLVRTDGNYPLEAQVVQAELQAVGIQTNITSYDLSTLESKEGAGNFDIAIMGFAWVGADPLTIVQIAYGPGGSLNFGPWNDATFDNMLTLWQQAIPDAQRQQYAYDAQEYFNQQEPVVVYCYEEAAQVAQKNIGGLEIDNFSGQLLDDNAYIK